METNRPTLAPNATAVNILRSWLNEAKIPNAQGEGCDLKVTSVDGKDVDVKVCLRGEEPPIDKVVVFTNEMTGKKLEVALAAFHRITEAAGYGKPQPLDRGAEPEKNKAGNPRKLHYRDEPFLVAIRHTEFRRSPNPSDDRWKKYKPTIEKTSWAFMRLNWELCLRAGYGIDDLMGYARCWTVNFCGRYEIANPKENENEKLLYVYLQQRFATDLRSILKKKERSVLPDAETVSVALYGRTESDIDHWSKDPLSLMLEREEALDESEVSDEPRGELDLSSATARRESAANLLQKLLGELPHDRLVEVLTETAQNTRFDITTRKEASRRLHVHVSSCGSCSVEMPDDPPVVVPEPVTPTRSLGTLLSSKQIPQADSVTTLRLLLEALSQEGGTERSNIELGAEIGVTERQVGYYKHAAGLLGFLANGEVTGWGEEFLAADAGSPEETSILRSAIEAMPAYENFAWYFTSGGSKKALVEHMIARYSISPGTAARRANTFIQWRAELVRLSNPGVEEDEDLAGADLGSPTE